jgi:hypothetical protein
MKKCNVSKFSRRRVLAFLLVMLSAKGSAGTSIDPWEGYYADVSKRCTVFDGRKNRFVSCARQFNDCIRIQKNSDKAYSVEVFSTQAEQHVCAVKGVAHVKNGALVLKIDEDEGQQYLELVHRGGRLQLKHTVPEDEIPKNCGAHASFDGMALKKVSARPGVQACFEG